ncbi:MAG: hypothetical protein AAF738_09360 [Bacteroidota bacterium]
MLRIKFTVLFMALASVFAFAEDPCDAATIPGCNGVTAIADGGLNTTAGPTSSPLYSCGSSENTVWFGPFVVPASGMSNFNTCTSDYDTQLAVYTTNDNACTGLDAEVDCNDDGCGIQSDLTVTGLAPGTILYVSVDGWGGATGNLVLSLDADTQTATDGLPSCTGTPPVPSITLVPTMTEWGMFLFALGMATLGLVFVYNKQRQLAQ